jgi:imidazole glycerol-phosphate synthase subunit HisH
LKQRGLEPALREVLASGKPLLGICLGLQVLFEHGQEQGGIPGLGILGGQVVKFEASAAGAAAPIKVPHIGWNQIEVPAGQRRDPMLKDIADNAYVYFVHSYYVVPSDRSIIAVETDYGGRFCAAIRRDNLFACQFHPEKSQRVGQQLLQNFVRQA